MAKLPEPEAPTAPVLDDIEEEDDIKQQEFEPEAQQEQNQLLLGQDDGDGDGAQQITYCAPYLPEPAPQNTNDIVPGDDDIKDDYKENKVVLQMETVQQQNEGGSGGNIQQNIDNNTTAVQQPYDTSQAQVNDTGEAIVGIAPSAPIPSAPAMDINEEQKVDNAIPLSTDNGILYDENKHNIMDPSAPNAPDIPPMAFEEIEVVQNEQDDDEKKDTLQYDNIEQNEALIDREYNETVGNEEMKQEDDLVDGNDDDVVLNDGETPGLTIPAAVSIPLDDDTPKHTQTQSVDRLDKDQEDIEKFEAQKAELIMEALPGQSEQQFIWKELRFNMGFRKELWRSAYHGSLDDGALVIAFLSIVFSVGFRAKQFKKCTEKYWKFYYTNEYSEWRYGCLYNLLYALYDIICLIGILITVICVVRIIPLYDQCKYDKSKVVSYGVSRKLNWTKYAWRNALSSPMDLIFLPFAIIVILSPHIIDMYREYLSFRNDYIQNQKLIVEFGEGQKEVEQVKDDGKLVLKEGELPAGGKFRITYSSLDVISMMKVRLLILKHALHWVFFDILILIPMFIISFIYWPVIWPTLKYITMSQWEDFKKMVSSGFLCCLKSLKCCKPKEIEPVHDGPAEIVEALDKGKEDAVPSAPHLSDNEEEYKQEEKEEQLAFSGQNDEEQQAGKKKKKIKRTLATAGIVYHSLTECIWKMFKDVLRILIIQSLAFVLKLISFQFRKIYIQFKRLYLNYRRYKIDFDPWRTEENIYKYAEDEKEFSYWCDHGMSREEALQKQLNQEKMVDRYTEKHTQKVRKVYAVWLEWLNNEDGIFDHKQHFRDKIPYHEATAERWRSKIKLIDETLQYRQQLDAQENENEQKMQTQKLLIADDVSDMDSMLSLQSSQKFAEISNKYKKSIDKTSNIRYIRQKSQKGIHAANKNGNVSDAAWQQVKAEKQLSTTTMAFQSISEFFLKDLPTFFMALFCIITIIRAYSIFIALPLIWGCKCGKNNGKTQVNKQQARELERIEVTQQNKFLNFSDDKGYDDLAFSTNKENEEKFRKIVRGHAARVPVDLVHVPFGLFAAVSIMRTVPFLKLFFVTYGNYHYEENRTKLRRNVCIAECMRAIRDLLCVPLCGIMLISTPWRLLRIWNSISNRSNHCVRMEKKYSDKQIIESFEGSFNSDEYIKVKSIKTKWNHWGAPIFYLILRKYKFQQKKGFNNQFIDSVSNLNENEEPKEHISFLQRYWNDKHFDKQKGYAKPISNKMSLYKFKSEGYLPERGVAYLLGKHFWRNMFKTFGLKTAWLFLQKNPINVVYEYYINDKKSNSKEFETFKKRLNTLNQSNNLIEETENKYDDEYSDEDDNKYAFDDTDIKRDELSEDEPFEEFGMIIKPEVDPIVQRGSCIDVFKAISVDNDESSPIIQFQDDMGRILMSLFVSSKDVLLASQNDVYDVVNFDLTIKKIQNVVAVHGSYKYFYDKITSSSSWNTFWWSCVREFIACLYDIPHIFLYIITWLLPWRGAVLTYQLRQHPVYRNKKVARRCIAMVEYSYIFLSRFRELVLVRSANDIMKKSFDSSNDNIQLRQNIWNNFWEIMESQWRELNDEANKMNESDIPMFLTSIQGIIKESEKHLFGGSNLSNLLHLDKLWNRYLILQRDKLYYTILRIQSNVETYIKQNSDEVVRSVILEKINQNVSQIDKSLDDKLDTIRAISDYLMEDIKRQNERFDIQNQKKCFSGFIAYKSQQSVHGSIRRMALKCFADLFVVFGILIMLIFHGMELISHLKQLLGYHWTHRKSEMRPDWRFGLRELVKYHVKYSFLDAWYLLKTFICLLIIFVTLVRVEGLMEDVNKASIELSSSRRLTLREFSHICWLNVRYKILGELYELLGLVTILKHWKRAIYSIVFAIFIATQGFQGIATFITFNRCCKVCPTSIRAIIQIIMWCGFVFYMFWQLCFVLDDFEVFENGSWQLTFNGKDAANDFTLYVIAVTCVSMFCQFLSDFWLSINDDKDVEERNKTKLKLWWFNVKVDYISTKMSISWPNLLYFTFIIFEIIQLTALPIFVLTQVNILKHDAGISTSETYLANNSSWNKFANFMQIFLFIYNGSNNPSKDFYILMLLTVIAIFIYLFVIAVPWAFGREQQDSLFGSNEEKEEESLNKFVQFKKWYYSAWFFSRILFVPFLINILKIVQCYWIFDEESTHWNGYMLSDVSPYSDRNDNKYQCFMDQGFSGKIYSFIIILTIGAVFYVFTVLAVMPQLFSRAILVAEDGIDIRFPLAFNGGWQLLQVLYIICIMFLPLVTTNDSLAENATVLGLLICLFMFLWTFLFPCLAKRKLKDIETGYDDIRLCTVPHIGMIRRYGILLPLLMCAYVKYLSGLNMDTNVGHLDVVAIFIIVLVTIVVIFAYIFSKRRALKKYRNNFVQSPVYNKLIGLINKCRQTGEGDFLGSWYSESSTTNNWTNSLQNAFTLSNAKSVVLQIESYIVIERLSHKFLHNRIKWRNDVLDCDDYTILENLVNELIESIQPLPSYYLALRILINDCDYLREAPMDISLLLLSFIYDNNELADQIATKPLKPIHILTKDRLHFKNTKLSILIGELFSTSSDVIYNLLNDIKAKDRYIDIDPDTSVVIQGNYDDAADDNNDDSWRFNQPAITYNNNNNNTTTSAVTKTTYSKYGTQQTNNDLVMFGLPPPPPPQTNNDLVMFGLPPPPPPVPDDNDMQWAKFSDDNFDEEEKKDRIIANDLYGDTSDDDNKNDNFEDKVEQFYIDLFNFYSKNTSIVQAFDIKAIIDSSNIDKGSKKRVYNEATQNNKEPNQKQGLNFIQFKNMFKMVAKEQQQKHSGTLFDLERDENNKILLPNLDYPKHLTVPKQIAVNRQQSVGGLINYGDLLTQINTINDSELRQKSFDFFNENYEALIAWIGANISRSGNRTMADGLWDKFKEDSNIISLNSKYKIDGGKYLAKILAIIVQMNKRSINWNNNIFDDSLLPNLLSLEYDLGHITCWIIRTKGVPSGTSIKLNNEYGYKILYKLEFTVSKFEKYIKEWVELYVNKRGQHRDSDGKAKT